MRCGILDAVMPYVSLIGDNGAVWIAIAAAMMFSRKWRKDGIAMAAALLLSLIIGNLTLKPLIARVRPFTINPDVLLLIKKPTDFSFPSGHTMSSFAAAAVIFAANKRHGTAALILAALIAFSRLYLYVHYPTDILAGVVIGILIAAISYKAVNSFL